MSAFLSPVFGAGWQLFDNQGVILSGGKIFTYAAGTTTPLATWTDSTQAIPNANPILLDGTGRLSQEVWLQQATAYKFVLTDANNVILGTWDNVEGLNDVNLSFTFSEWTQTGLTPTYISATSFSVSGNNTSVFPINRRIQAAVGAGTIYGYVTSSSFGGSTTTVTIQPDASGLDSGLSSVNVGLISSVNTSAPQQFMAANAPVSVASAATTPIGVALSVNVTVTGTTTITAFDTVLAGIIRFVKFADILTLTHNGTSLILPAAVDITTGAGDQATFRSLGSGNWECISYQVASYDTTKFPTGTRMVFNQTAAPTGWTKDTTAALDDTAMRITTGTVGSGGTNAFTTANYTPTLSIGTLAVAGHALTIAEMPTHAHTELGLGAILYTGSGASPQMMVAGTGNGVNHETTSATGSGGAHTHSLTGTETSSTITLDLKYNDFIIATKN